jgi:hypothetical protein
MNRRSAFALVVIGLVLGLGEHAAKAGPITWEFSGQIGDVFDPDNDLGAAITVGTPFSGSFTFESTTADSNPASAGFGTYVDAITAISGYVGTRPFFASDSLSSQINITDSGGDNDVFSFGAEGIIFSDFAGEFDMSFVYSDPDASAFSSDALPLFPPELTSSAGAAVSFSAVSGRAAFDGNVVVLVPEPGTLALLVFGTLAIIKRRRYSRSFSSLGVLFLVGLGLTSDLRAQQWDPNWGPVIIGGDDFDEHRSTMVDQQLVLTGDAFTREGFRFLVANVKTQNKLAVCVGCQGAGLTAFRQNFEAANLLGWTRAHLNVINDIEGFFTNDVAAPVKIQDAGLIYITSDIEELTPNNGISGIQIDAVNENATALRNFVKVDGGGLFTHTLFGFAPPRNGYLWLETLVPEIRPAAFTFGSDVSVLACAGDDVFFQGITDAQRDAIAISNAKDAWHNRFETVPGEPRLGGLSVVLVGDIPPTGLADFVILAAPIPTGFGDCNGDGIPDACDLDCNNNGVDDGCDISAGDSLDCNENGIPDECEIADGTSEDCDGDGVLNECEMPPWGTGPDCNANGLPDSCDADGLLWSIRNERLSASRA